jgi:hypothetical protein
VIGISLISSKVPESFSLSQNYPNPFNGTTTIEYALPEASHVALEIYDPLGRKVRTLVDDARDAGIHREVLEARDLPSGLYVYRLTAGVFRDMRKLLLIR